MEKPETTEEAATARIECDDLFGGWIEVPAAKPALLLSVLVVGILEGEEKFDVHEGYWARDIHDRWRSIRKNEEGRRLYIRNVTHWAYMPKLPSPNANASGKARTWPPSCPHCGDELLTSEDRGLHCDGCDDLTAEEIEKILTRFNSPNPD